MSSRAAIVEAPSVPRLWSGETVVVVAGGPSVTREDCALIVASPSRILAIKDAVRLFPADRVGALYACDAKWWRYHKPDYPGPRYSIDTTAAAWATILRNTGPRGLELDPTGLRTGKNSGYQAINLAVHLGAARIVLVGYDMQPAGGRDHWFGKHPYGSQPPPYQEFRPMFDSLVEPLAAAGVEVVNATRRTALTSFPLVPLEEALR